MQKVPFFTVVHIPELEVVVVEGAPHSELEVAALVAEAALPHPQLDQVNLIESQLTFQHCL